MKKEEKKVQKEVTEKKSKKGLIIIIVVSVLVVGVMVLFSLNGDKKIGANKTIVKPKTVNKIQKVEDKIVVDSASVLDTINSNTESKVMDQIVTDEVENDQNLKTTNKSKKSITDHENNPNNWSLVIENGKDTSFYVIKNKKTGTKLSNRYYSKKKGDKELQNFKNILAN